MTNRFKEILDEASKRVEGWLDWKKSDALRMSETTKVSGAIPKPQNPEADDKHAVARTFSTTNKEQKHINNWIKEHAQTCPILSNPATQGWLGSPIHYIFTPCSFCTSIRIQCNCGAEFNVPSDPDLI